MSETIGRHIRENVVAYVALFLVISGGTAYATHPGGANTISTVDIINGEVRAADLKGNSVTDAKIRDETIASADVLDDSLAADDLAASSVSTQELANNQIRSADVRDDTSAGGGLLSEDIANESLTGADVDDGSLTGVDVAPESLGTAEINEENLNVVDARSNGLGAGNPGITSGREQLSGSEAGPSAVILASGVANVNAEKNSNDDCTLTLLNSPFSGSTYTFTRQVMPSGGGATFTNGTLAQGASDSAGPFAGAVHVRWQAWATGNPTLFARVLTVEASAVPTGTTCDFMAVMTIGS